MFRAVPGASYRPAAILLALWLPACRKPEGVPRIEREAVDLRLGVAGVVDPGRWNLLQLRVKNQGEDFRGTLTVEGISAEGGGLPPPYRMALEIPGRSTTTRLVSFPVRPEGWLQVELTFRQPGYERRFLVQLPGGDEARLRILAIGETPGDLDFLRELAAENWLKHSDPTLVGPGRLELPRMRSPEIPTLPLSYDPFRLIVLWGTTLAGAPPGGLAALREWVESGGTLVAFPGSEWAGGLGEEFAALLGVTSGDPQAKPPPAIAAAATGFYRQLLPGSGCEEIEGGLAFRSSLGAGSVTTFSMEPSGRRFPAPEEAPALYRPLRFALARALTFSGDPDPALGQLESGVAAQLFEMSGFRVPERLTVALGLLVYLALGFLLPGFVFRKLGRREWAFAAVVLAAGAAVWGIYRYGLLSPLRGAEIEEITVLRIHPDRKSAEATSYLGIISPGMRTVELPAPEGARPSGLRAQAMNRFQRRPPLSFTEAALEVDGAGRFRLPPLRLFPNAMRFARYDYRIPLEPEPQPFRYRGTPLVPPGSASATRGATHVVNYESMILDRLEEGGPHWWSNWTEGGLFPAVPGLKRNARVMAILERPPLTP
jgi:hypothetical protein